MNRVTLIQCTNTKRDHPARAEHLYDKSSYFRAMRAWARDRGNPWYILSAEHGLVAPGTILDPYDARGLSDQQADRIAETLHGAGVETVDITAGQEYTTPLVPALESYGIEVIEHFAGQRIGTRQQNLRAAVGDSE